MSHVRNLRFIDITCFVVIQAYQNLSGFALFLLSFARTIFPVCASKKSFPQFGSLRLFLSKIEDCPTFFIHIFPLGYGVALSAGFVSGANVVRPRGWGARAAGRGGRIGVLLVNE